MVELYSTPRLESLIAEISHFLEDELIPRENEFLHTPFLTLEKGALLQLRNQIKSKGWWAPHLSQEKGGLGLSLTEFAQLSEVLATTPLGHYVFNCQAPDIGNMELLDHFADEAIKKEYLEPLENGDIRSCFSMTEPENAGSNPILLHTTAIRQDEHYIINGHKWFTSSADGAAFAIVMAVTNPDAPVYERASMLIVPTHTPGFEIVRNIPVMGEAGEGYISHSEIRYTHCKVPASNLIHKEGSGFLLAQQRLGPGRIHHCMRWIGISERALKMMCHRAATRKIDAQQMLGHKQSIQNWLAESRAEINAARLLVLDTAARIEKHGSKAAREEISAIKFYVAGVMHKVLDRAIQTHGALGITDDTTLAWWYRHERGARIYDGPDEVHKSVLARGMLKKFGLDIKKTT